MPTYEVEDERGRKLELEGDHPPTDSELADIFASTFAPSRAVAVPAPGERGPRMGSELVSGVTAGQPPEIGARVAQAAQAPEEQALQTKLETPLVNLPVEIYAAPLTTFFAPDIARGLATQAKSLIEGQTSPSGLAAIPYIAAGSAEALALKGAGMAGRVVAGAFGAQGLSELPGAVRDYVSAVREGDREKAAAAWAKLAVSSGMALGGAEGLRGKPANFEPPRIAGELLEVPVNHEVAQPMATETFKQVIGPERQLVGAAIPMPEVSESTLNPSGAILTHGAEPGEVITRISLPVEPETAKAARQIWSKPIDIEAQAEGVDALRQLSSMTEETKAAGEPYKPPTVNVDLRQLERMMQRNTVSRVESWADEVINNKLKETGANPYFDPEFLAAAATKGAILFKRGVTKLDEWNAEMKRQFGAGIDDLLPKIYEQSRDYWEKRESGALAAPGEVKPAAVTGGTTTEGTANAIGKQVSTAPNGNVLRNVEGRQVPAEPVPTDVTGQAERVRGNENQGPTGAGTQTEAPVEPSTNEGAAPFGISDKARSQMAETGRVAYTPPGEGTNAWAQIQRGRELMREGRDPEAALADFEKTRRVSADDMALARAKGEDLYRASEKVLSEKGAQSPEYLAAQQRLLNWMDRIKPMSTEWHRIGEAQQGMTDIDTGSLVGLEKAYHDATGREFTPRQRKEAEGKAGDVKETREAAGKAQKDVETAIDKAVGKGAGKVPATPEAALDVARKAVAQGAKEGKLPIETVRAIWQHAKRSYIEKGIANIDEIAQGVANDLGLPKKTVMDALAGAKGVRKVTDEMYLKMARARQAQAAARAWLINQQSPGWLNWLRRVPRFFFSAKVFGHGTVGMVTHAGPLMFDPRVAGDYWTNFARQYALAYKAGYHEAMMQDLMHRPNFIAAKRAGLANDPFRFQDDYQNPTIQLGIGWFTKAGNRGFDSLKLLRQDLYDRAWERLSGDQRSPVTAAMIADGINHSTGIITSKIPGKLGEALATAMFAPKLEGSRWAFAIGDPTKAAITFAHWKSASPEGRMQAIGEIKQKAVMAGTYLGLLAVNQALLSAMGSDQSVNFTDPRRGDFLSFKAFGHEISVIHPMTRMVGLLADLYRIARSEERGKVEKLSSRRDELGTRVWEYGQGKLSPFAQPVLDLASQSDFQGRPLPFSNDKTPRYLKRQGQETYTWPEYLANTLAPIPVEEAIKEVWASQGMDEKQMKTALKALSVFTITGGTGIRLSEDKRAGQ